MINLLYSNPFACAIEQSIALKASPKIQDITIENKASINVNKL